MHIIIAGAGEVGFQVAKMLAYEDHDIILIDKDQQKLSYAESHLDVSALWGNALSIETLESAGIHQTDLLIAATSDESTNISTGIIGKRLGAKKTIIRITNTEFQTCKDKLDLCELGIDHMVFPEKLAAHEIHRLLKLSNSTDSFEFGNGKLTLTGFFLNENAALNKKSLIEASQLNPELAFTVVAIHRGNKTIIPRGDTNFKAGDHVYFISKPTDIPAITALTGNSGFEIKKVMILGGGLLGRQLANLIQQEYRTKLVDVNKEKCFYLANDLSETMIIHGDGRDVELLVEEGIDDMDAFIALTNDSETNIISCLVAKKYGVKRTIALVENINYISLSQNIGIDTLINKKIIAINNIFRHVRSGHVEAITSLHGVDSEILEFIVHPGDKISSAPIRKLNFPRNAIIAGIIRNEESFIASGNSQIEVGDRVVVFTMPKEIKRVEAFFS